MQEDNAYQGSSQYLAPPDSQVAEADKERDLTLANAPQVMQTIENLKASIAIYSSVDGIHESTLTDKNTFMHVVAANKIVVELLRKEVMKLEGPIKEHVTAED